MCELCTCDCMMGVIVLKLHRNMAPVTNLWDQDPRDRLTGSHCSLEETQAAALDHPQVLLRDSAL